MLRHPRVSARERGVSHEGHPVSAAHAHELALGEQGVGLHLVHRRLDAGRLAGAVTRGSGPQVPIYAKYEFVARV